jgi:hypothetical protein
MHPEITEYLEDLGVGSFMFQVRASRDIESRSQHLAAFIVQNALQKEVSCETHQAIPTSDHHIVRRSLDRREGCTLANAALSTCFSVTLLDADVAILAEASAPTILHLPKLHAIINAITDGKHAMVQILSARVIGEHTTCVVLEDRLVRLDGNGDGLLRDSGFQCHFRCGHVSVLRDIADSKRLGHWLGGAAFTVTEALVGCALASVNETALVAR